ncbi:hypothetical protein K8B83_17685 [Shewanella inventionis]|uniref:hypothetical protein n=1 Tax=Shewanella inventionis TaxID=1738770 RepID=UPI001CBC1C41|nr:hypothetical protein [Shewanella inventionis]UAL42639.1 hypothetical protein K8B83_17685 [Shewanella inventionis]
MNIKIVVVLFNKKLNESKTLVTLTSQVQAVLEKKHQLNIYDNSKLPCLNSSDLKLLESNYYVNYKHNKNNLPLSTIYKEQFDLLSSDEYLLLLDDDSKLPDDYISNFISTRKTLSSLSGIVFVPKVITHSSLISPYKSFFVFSKPYNSNGFSEKVFAMNSGIFIPKFNDLNLFVYPEYAKFYGTDTVLFEFLHFRKVKIYVLDSYIQHDLSFHPDNDKVQYLSSLVKVICFWREHYSFGLISQFFFKVYLFMLSIKLSIKYKTLINLFNIGTNS